MKVELKVDDYQEKVTDYLDEFVKALKEQLEKDEKRWGETWKFRSYAGQTERIKKTFDDYFDMAKNGNVPINWLKIAGNAMIAWIREYEMTHDVDYG